MFTYRARVATPQELEEVRFDRDPQASGWFGAADQAAAAGAAEFGLGSLGWRWLQRESEDWSRTLSGIAGDEEALSRLPRLLDPDEANERFGIEGVLSFNERVSERQAADLWGIKQRELLRADTVARASGDRWWSQLGYGVLGGTADPVGAALTLVPVGRLEALRRLAPGLAAAEASGNVLARAGAGAAFGAVEGLAGAALLEAPTNLLATDLGYDYTLTDSLVNLLAGAGLGSVVGGAGAALFPRPAGGGAAFDARSRYHQEQLALAVGEVAAGTRGDAAPSSLAFDQLAENAFEQAQAAGARGDDREALAQARLAQEIGHAEARAWADAYEQNLFPADADQVRADARRRTVELLGATDAQVSRDAGLDRPREPVPPPAEPRPAQPAPPPRSANAPAPGVEGVRRLVADELAATGRYAPDQAQANAEVFAAMFEPLAREYGEDVADFYARVRPAIVGEEPIPDLDGAPFQDARGSDQIAGETQGAQGARVPDGPDLGSNPAGGPRRVNQSAAANAAEADWRQQRARKAEADVTYAEQTGIALRTLADCAARVGFAAAGGSAVLAGTAAAAAGAAGAATGASAAAGAASGAATGAAAAGGAALTGTARKAVEALLWSSTSAGVAGAGAIAWEERGAIADAAQGVADLGANAVGLFTRAAQAQGAAAFGASLTGEAPPPPTPKETDLTNAAKPAAVAAAAVADRVRRFAALSSLNVPGEDDPKEGTRQTAEALGLDGRFLNDLFQHESAFRPRAIPRRRDGSVASSARGLGQFLEGTWLGMIQQHGARLGRPDLAAAVTRNGRGTLVVTDPAVRQEILNLRYDTRWMSVMSAIYADQNAQVLRRELGRDITHGEAYLGHFMGVGNALRMIRAAEANHPNAARLFPRQAADNENVFWVQGNRSRPRTAQQVIERQMSGFSDEILEPLNLEDPGA